MALDVGRLWRTVRWLRPIQWRYRAWYTLRGIMGLSWTRHGGEGGPIRVRTKAGRPWSFPAEEERLQRAVAVMAGEFTFANETRHFPEAPEWLPQVGAGRFWEYNLHYFDFAVDLAAAYQQSAHPGYLDRLRFLIDSWSEACAAPGTPIAWDAGPLSHRLKNWARVAMVFHEELSGDDAFWQSLSALMHGQASFLERHLEYHLLGNHLITNGAALLFASSLFDGKAAARWRAKGLKILRGELRAQFLADGGHEERSPMYHALMLEDFLDCLELERHLGASWFDAEDRALLERAVRFLVDTLHPDGEIALLNDAALGIAPAPEMLIARAVDLLSLCPEAQEPPDGHTALSETGWYIWRDGDNFLLFDAGDVGPDHNPAHAHGDTLSFELSVGAQRVITDSGTYGYGGDAWQAYCVGTRAHNTVMLDGEEQIEKWGPRYFRVGRRPHAEVAGGYETGGAHVFFGRHDGYTHLPGQPRHMRHVIRLAQGVWVIHDEITGTGTHTVESFLHFHPEITLRRENSAMTALWNGGHLLLRTFGPGTPETVTPGKNPLQGWYCPEFGVAHERAGLCLRANGPLPLRFGWLSAVGVSTADINLTEDTLVVTADAREWRLNRDATGRITL
jgi:uncharacterized heparinase superfamily protein